MGRLVIAILLLNSSIALTQRLAYMRGFERLDENTYFLRCSSEEEAIKQYMTVWDMNNIDTTRINFYRGDNPVANGYFKVDKSSNQVVSSFIVKHNYDYDIWFMQIEDKDTHFLNVEDKNGDIKQLTYIKP
jgi:hypothetical protein